MSRRPTKQEILGKIGEDIVEACMKQDGDRVVRSPDPYDIEKDMLVNDVRVEVKFQTPYYGFRSLDGTEMSSFTVDITSSNSRNPGGICQNQLSKCTTVPRLLFVENPLTHKHKDTAIRVWEAPKPGERKFLIGQGGFWKGQQRIIAAFPMDQFRLVAKVRSQTFYQMIEKANISRQKVAERG